MLIDRLMPEFDVAEHHRARVLAPPDRTYAAARSLDLARSHLIRALFAARGLPLLVRGRRATPASMTLDDLLEAGFVWLGECPGVEFVLGVVGAFWRPAGGILRIDAGDFEGFDLGGCAKAAWNFRVVPVRDESRSIVSTETRVRVPDGLSRKKFLLYWAAIGPFSGLIRRRALALITAEAEAGAGAA